EHTCIFRPDIVAREPTVLQHCLGASANSRSKVDRFCTRDVVELLRFMIDPIRIRSGRSKLRCTCDEQRPTMTDARLRFLLIQNWTKRMDLGLGHRIAVDFADVRLTGMLEIACVLCI